jgi:hypothetical protein
VGGLSLIVFFIILTIILQVFGLHGFDLRKFDFAIRATVFALAVLPLRHGRIVDDGLKILTIVLDRVLLGGDSPARHDHLR